MTKLQLATLSAVLLAFASPGFAAESTQRASEKIFRAGAATSNIAPYLDTDLIGGFNPRGSTHIHDELHVRCLALDDGKTQLVFAIVDNVQIRREVIDAAKQLVHQSTGLPKQNLLMAATHTHSTTVTATASAFAPVTRRVLATVAAACVTAGFFLATVGCMRLFAEEPSDSAREPLLETVRNVDVAFRDALAADKSAVEELVRRAGNADSDAQRLKLLKQLRALPELDSPLADDADKLIPFVEKWVEGKSLHFYGREVSKKQDVDLGITDSSPLYPLTYLYRGRTVLTRVMQSGNLWSYPDRVFVQLRALYERGALHGSSAPFSGRVSGRRPLGRTQLPGALARSRAAVRDGDRRPRQAGSLSAERGALAYRPARHRCAGDQQQSEGV